MIYKNFNEQWRLIKGGSSAMIASFLGKEEECILHLPHDAMIHEERTPNTPSGAQTGFYPGGEYTYIKTIDVPDEWKDKKIILEFEGIYQIARVYINGALAKKNVYGYSNFYVTLNEWLNFGENNTIKVLAHNSIEPNSRWYTGSGIYRNVKLLIGESIHIVEDGVRVTTTATSEESAIIEVQTKLENITRKRERVAVTVNLLREGRIVGKEKQCVVMYPQSREICRHNLSILKPELWDCDSPNLYECQVIVAKEEKYLDEVKVNFGIRTLTLDAYEGLKINGKEVKLRGACIHHDNGILGAVTLEGAEQRRCRQLKEAGFNSIRSAHHPISKAMLDACDQYGMLVMDELSDIWTVHKNPCDFALDFESCWEETIEKMVAKDYNHPSVIIYSVGNEITEAGSEAGARINRRLCNKFHELDHTRYTTNALNGLMAAGYRLKSIMKDVYEKFENEKIKKEEDSGGSNALNSFMSLMAGEKGEYFAKHPLLTEALEGCSSACDIIGLNYLTGRHVLERELHPNKTVIGTETYPADIVRLWNLVKNYTHILGDFTWTGYDYLGEAGCGIFHYDGNENFTSVYPERVAYIGDIDLIGYRRPISHLREIVYGLCKKPYIAVERLNRYGVPSSKTPWMHKDNIASWTWPGYEGRPAVIDVYADADEVELFLNGISKGRMPSGEAHQFTATYELGYEPGELRAVAYSQGKEVECFILNTAKEVAGIELVVDKKYLKADGEDLSFITLKLIDEDGIENLFESKNIEVVVEGVGNLAGFGSADPQSLGSYSDTEWETYDGYLMAVIRSSEQPGMIRVTFKVEGCGEQVLELVVEE